MELSIKDIKDLLGSASNAAAEPNIEVGENYFFRTVTQSYVGRVTHVSVPYVGIEDASWVADSGRFNEFLSGKLDSNAEMEKYSQPPTINLGAVIEFVRWPHNLPNQTI